MELWTGFFIFFTIMHPIADFIAHNKLGKKWHYLISLNPLHPIWDKLFSFHNKWIDIHPGVYKATVMKLDQNHHIYSYFQDTPRTLGVLENNQFWWRLGIDQTMHVLLNLVWAFICVHLLALYFPESPLLTL